MPPEPAPRAVGLVAREVGLAEDEWIPYGRTKAKIPLAALQARRARPNGKLVVVSSITPTPAGEGKTTITIGLGQALWRVGSRAVIALRQPSIGPTLGQKGGGTGGGRAQVVPMEEINLHFTGDFHAVTTAHNLLAAALDNHLYHGNDLGIDPRQVLWRRVMDMNDRALRQIVLGLGGRAQGFPREDGFLITAASEVMALLCLAGDLDDLKARLARMLVAFTFAGKPVLAGELGVTGAMAALLRDAIQPNLVQTLEGTPALVHGGPFANIAHGCNSVVATKLALKLGDVCVTEAGFGFDLGAEKFFDIKCRYAGLTPDAVVLVATVRALKYHGTGEDLAALERGMANLDKHVEAIRLFRVPLLVAINRFPSDTERELGAVIDHAARLGVKAVVADVFGAGGAGGAELARQLLDLFARERSQFTPLYDWGLPVREKIALIAGKMYGADGVFYPKPVERLIDRIQDLGYGGLPICMAKTPRSLSDDPELRGRPRDFRVTVNDVRISAGAGFLVPITGDILTMPGLPKHPNAERIDVTHDGAITGLE
ncbi:MAG: Formate--tetrahydrofolate ligase, formate--tetrahydrofolate ligase [Candidatus Rokubacteria bacterium CSP1-6]|nr:MAG: Formate--tetrahydrofolate ligase, formate--tetrahydrofolate ligase [Candidatus Rokubacteria bacterium CSP1-6]